MTFLVLPRLVVFFFFSSRRRHTRFKGDWSSDVCSSDLYAVDKTRSSLLTPLPNQKPSRRKLKDALPASRPSRSAFGFAREDRLPLQRRNPRRLSQGDRKSVV